MKLQNLTLLFIIIVLPIILILSLYISNGLKTIEYQTLYDDGLVSATADALYAFEANTANDELSDNPEVKRDIINASIKMFEKSLCNTCNISSYNTSEIEEYIPAMVFGMYDGFYMYAPSYNLNTEKYEHSLKNYVYYSETLKDYGKNGTDIIITYSLDNYITVCGNFGDGYEIKKGYLSVMNGANNEGTQYNDIYIVTELIDGNDNTEGQQYYANAYNFTLWFKEFSDVYWPDYLTISEDNNPEDPNSRFNQHKRQVIKGKIEGVLNSTITAYSEKTWGQNYKMPKLSEEDWEKVYSNISMITFFQGKQIGFTKYNGYTVVNSSNNTEYVNPSLMYFTDNSNEYHDIRCEKIQENSFSILNSEGKSILNGYRIGRFEETEETEETATTEGAATATTTSSTTKKTYKHEEQACYSCVNDPLSTSQSVYEYITSKETSNKIKSAYWTSLGRERYNTSNEVTWTDIFVTIKFSLNDSKDALASYSNENSIFDDRTEKYGTNKTINLNDTKTKLTREGYNLKGWSKTSSASATYYDSYNFEINEDFKKDTTYYAIWAPVYKIKFEGYDAVEYEAGQSVEVPDGPSKEGYDFVGWSTEENTTEKDDDITTATKDATYYPIYVKKKYTVKYYMNDGSSNELIDTVQNVEHGTSITLKEAPTRTGYTFEGWNTNKAAANGNDAETQVTVTSNLDYYAIWKIKTYTITYNANGGSGAPSAQTKTHGEELTLTNDKPTNEGYDFEGWKTNNDTAKNVEYKSGEKYSKDENVTLYAVWKIKTYTVTYNANGGTGAPEAQTKTHGVDLTLSSTVPTRTGYKFNGWGTSSSTTKVDYAKGETYSNDADITLYAIWEAKTYTVTYNANEGTGAPEAQTKTHGVDLTLSSTVPTRTGYKFNGWGTSSSTTKVDYEKGGKYSNDANIALYAIWTANTYTVKYDENGGSGSMGNSTHTYDVAQNLNANTFTREGYGFMGWATSEDGTKIYDTEQSVTNLTTTNGAVITLYAVWQKNNCTITYYANYNGATEPYNQYSVSKGTEHTLIAGPARDGYTFLGWNTSSTATSGSNAGTTITVNGNKTYYAIYKTWEANDVKVYFQKVEYMKTKEFIWDYLSTNIKIKIEEIGFSGAEIDGVNSKEYDSAKIISKSGNSYVVELQWKKHVKVKYLSGFKSDIMKVELSLKTNTNSIKIVNLKFNVNATHYLGNSPDFIDLSFLKGTGMSMETLELVKMYTELQNMGYDIWYSNNDESYIRLDGISVN